MTSREPVKMSLRELLRDELSRRQETNPHYSLRGFAKYLGVNYATLSKILNGHRRIGVGLARKIAAKLDIDDDQLSVLIEEIHGRYSEVSESTFNMVPGLKHHAVMELIRTSQFCNEPSWIAQRLKSDISEIKAVIDDLIKASWLKIEADGSFCDTSGVRTTSIQFASTEAKRCLQESILRSSLDALANVPFENRDHSSITMAIDSRKIEQAKERIKKFRREMAKFLSRSGSPDEVYNLNVSLYPVSDLTGGVKSCE